MPSGLEPNDRPKRRFQVLDQPILPGIGFDQRHFVRKTAHRSMCHKIVCNLPNFGMYTVLITGRFLRRNLQFAAATQEDRNSYQLVKIADDSMLPSFSIRNDSHSTNASAEFV